MTYVLSTPRTGIVDISSVVASSSIGQPGISTLPSVTTESQFGEVVAGWDPNLGGGEFMFARCATTVVAAQTISSITVSSGTATLTTGSAHGLVVGQAIQISGATPSAYNGIFTVVTVPSSTTLTFVTTATSNATVVGSYVAGIGVGMTCELAYTLTSGFLIITATPWTGTVNTSKPLAISMANVFPGQASWYQVQGAAIALTNGTVTAGSAVYWQSNGTVSNTVVASKQMTASTAASANGATIGSGSTAATLATYMALVFIQRPTAQGAIT